ncbi:MAG: STAS domain-containing protein [Pseudomonadota bacterium]|uniref:STAS domain-containing protein n=1 Tax=Polaromonas sp. TaxID=1869339 RepID=UPI0017D6E32A|nr:STAS domain-containing protein [Polaromonas sp.]MBA3594765.1 STAS domain-containing protein [Polaromonas sp.]MDQ3272185.1 STAS domain-containing protein [Pseudomonadota bacterium]
MFLLPERLTHDLAAPSVEALGVMLAGETGPEVVADASALREFDSSALAVLLACRRQVLAAGKRFSVLALPDRLRQLAGLYGVQDLLPAA